MERYFEWDANKASSNYKKHGIRFELAAEVFDDPLGKSEQDRVEHGEERWRVLGVPSRKDWLLMVAYTIRVEDGESEIVRIISARRASRKERKIYEHA